VGSPPSHTPGTVSSLISAIDWVGSLLTGSLATLVAVLAIGFVGYRLLLGEMPLRDAARVVVGCFILFGAPLVVRGLVGAIRTEPTDYVLTTRPWDTVPMPLAPDPPDATVGGNPFDPYSGATNRR
jgi:type IV secretory pathway VirB2 component (pilin)